MRMKQFGVFLQNVKFFVIQYNLFFLWWLSIIYLETVIRISTSGRWDDAGLFFGTLFGATLALIISGLLYLIKNTLWFRLSHVLLMGLIGVVFASQLVYYRMMRTFYTLYSAGNAGKVLEFAGVALQGVADNIIYVIFMFIPMFFSLIGLKKINANASFSLKKGVVAIVIVVLVHLGTIGLIWIGDKSENSPYTLYYNVHYPEFSVNNLGVLTYMRVDAQRTFFGWKPKIELADFDTEIEIPVLTEVTSQENTTGETPILEDFEPPKPVPIVYNIMDIDFDALIASETDETLLEMHQYFKTVEPTKQNDHTGKYKDYNLIFITAEGFSHLAVRPDVTPTLYKMMHEGIYFSNFYTSPWGVSTSDGEYVATTSLIPKSGVWSYRATRDNAMPFAMGNQLRSLGFTTKAYHNHTYTYYDRHLSHPNMGYDYKGVGNGLEIKKTWPESDLEMMEVTIPEYIGEAKFHTYYMTVSGHMYYAFDKNAMSSKNREVVADLPYSSNVRAYLASQVEFDRAMAYLLEQLETAGKLDNTLIAISADHYPYGLTNDEISELVGAPVETNFELYRNAFIVYASGMTPEEVDKPATSLDILPTLSNLLGLTYDSRLMIGRDLFSDVPPLAIFSNRSFISDYGSYNSNTGDFVPSDAAKTVDEATLKTYRKQISNQINAHFYFSTKILEKNYYAEVFQK